MILGDFDYIASILVICGTHDMFVDELNIFLIFDWVKTINEYPLKTFLYNSLLNKQNLIGIPCSSVSFVIYICLDACRPLVELIAQHYFVTRSVWVATWRSARRDTWTSVGCVEETAARAQDRSTTGRKLRRRSARPPAAEVTISIL